MGETKPKIRVYVLGAGCSAAYGYPLAKDFVTALESYGQTLGDDAKRIRKCIEDSVALMRKENVATLDDLVSRISNSVFDEPHQGDQERYFLRQQRIRDARIATAALFLSKESAAKRTGLTSYHEFIHKLFPDTGHWQQRLRNSEYRVLTFNYDRLFEIALLNRWGIDADNFLLYSPTALDSGFPDLLGHELAFGRKGFQFLKLHGSAGMRVKYDNFGLRHFPQHDGRNPGREVQILDERFLAKADDPNPYSRDPEPLIVFPSEKQLVRAQPHVKPLYRDYILKVWQEAEAVMAEADEIWIVGYSFAALDRREFLALLSKATRCKKFVIQNREGVAEKICRRLKAEHSDLAVDWQPYGEDF